MCSVEITRQPNSALPFLVQSFLLGNLTYSHTVNRKLQADDDHVLVPDLVPEFLWVLRAQPRLLDPPRQHLKLSLFQGARHVPPTPPFLLPQALMRHSSALSSATQAGNLALALNSSLCFKPHTPLTRRS